MRAVAVDVLDENIGGVGLGGEAIVADVDPCVADREAINVI